MKNRILLAIIPSIRSFIVHECPDEGTEKISQQL